MILYEPIRVKSPRCKRKTLYKLVRYIKKHNLIEDTDIKQNSRIKFVEEKRKPKWYQPIICFLGLHGFRPTCCGWGECEFCGDIKFID